MAVVTLAGRHAEPVDEDLDSEVPERAEILSQRAGRNATQHSLAGADNRQLARVNA
jgi:hypothetical protein